jgi:hypothetical protein
MAGPSPALSSAVRSSASIALLAALLASAAPARVDASGPAAPSAPAASASAEPSSDPDADPAADAPLPDPATLPELPKLAPITHPAPTAEATQELDRLFARLTSGDAHTRDVARAAIPELAEEAWVPAVRVKIQDLRESLDRDRAPRILEDARKAVREARKKERKGKKGKGAKKDDDDEKDDWLEFVQDRPKPDDAAWRDLVRLLGCVRVLAAVGTTPAVREIIDLRAYFGEMLRVDLQRHIKGLGDRAVPALIEARRHDAQIVQRFAELELDKLGRAIPGEAVGTSDPQVLTDVLRAFGRTRDVDAVRVALSFANHDRRKVRDAAREAVSAIGEAGRWQLRDAFEDLRGEKPPKSAPWSDVAKWIFWLYDRGRLAEAERAVAEGFALQKEGKHDEAVKRFDDVLARDPFTARRAEMVPSYLAVARETPLEEADGRLVLLRKALRLDPEGEDRARIEAEIAYTEAKALEAQGRPDRFLLRRALELDPGHAGAKEALADFETRVVEAPASKLRLGAAGGVGAAALLVAAVIALTGRRRRRTTARDQAHPDVGS